MNQHILLLDLQFLKFTYAHTPYPSTAGLLIAGYHKAQRDHVMLSSIIPNFAMYDKIYIIKDDWDLYYDPEWLKLPNVVLVGRFWDKVMQTWNSEWELYPPDATPYTTWADNWLALYPSTKIERMEYMYYTPVLLKQGNRITAPEGDTILLIDYDLHKIDPDFSTLKELNIKHIRTLHPINVTDNPKAAFSLFKQRHMRKSLWATMDIPMSQEKLDEIIHWWNYYRPGRTTRLKVWLEGHSENEWVENLHYIIPFLAQWRERAGKRIFVEPVDEFTCACPDLLYFLRRWTGRDMGYAYNSLLDYAIYDSLQDLKKIEELLRDPYTAFEKYAKTVRRRPKADRVKEIFYFIKNNPDIAELISKPVNGKGV